MLMQENRVNKKFLILYLRINKLNVWYSNTTFQLFVIALEIIYADATQVIGTSFPAVNKSTSPNANRFVVFTMRASPIISAATGRHRKLILKLDSTDGEQHRFA
jgi:hypothetical protein